MRRRGTRAIIAAVCAVGRSAKVIDPSKNLSAHTSSEAVGRLWTAAVCGAGAADRVRCADDDGR